MQLRLLLATVIYCLLANSAVGQEWAKKMFSEHTHDFGVVARAAKEEYRFEFQNIYKESVHISGVRASCGCAIPRIENGTLNTWEKGAIVVKFNTLSFMGKRGATITVSIDRPYPAEVQLRINGFIRGDVVFTPGEVNFGSIDQGTEGTQVVSVAYAGRPDWMIQDVQSANPNLEVELAETERFNGRVKYNLLVRLKPNTKSGFFTDEMILVTNDLNGKKLPVHVTGNITAALQVSPVSLSMGILNPGESIVRNVVVRGKKPFKITSIKCKDDCFAMETPKEAKLFHLIPVKFTADKRVGSVTEKIEIETDLEAGKVGAFTATATVRQLKDG